jgi:hypothetical protein
MSALSVEVPYPVFTDRDGEPLENGYVWVGVANQNPQTNPVQVYFDRDLTQPAAQPLRTIAGYISNAGTPAQIYVNAADYSILVQDKNGTMVYNFPDGTGLGPNASGLSFTGFKGQVGNVQDLADNDGSDWIGFEPAGTNVVARSAQDKMREIVSAKDFGAVGNGVTNDTQALLDFLAFIRSNRVHGECKGTFLITAPFELDIRGANCEFNADFVTANISEVGVVIRAGVTTGATGTITATCASVINDTSITDYNNRRQDIGVFITSSGRSTLPVIRVSGTKRIGVLISSGSVGSIPGSNTNMFGVELLQPNYTGSARLFSFTPTTITNTGASTSTNQSCLLTFGSALPTTLRQRDFVEINNQLLVVMGVDFSTNTITAYPQLNDTTLSTARLFIGAGVEIIGSDANVGGIGLVDATRCGTAVKAFSLYGGFIGRIHTSVGGVGIAIGRPTSSVSYGGTVGYLYTESFTWEVAEISVAIRNWQVMGGIGPSGPRKTLLAPVGFRSNVRTLPLVPNSSPQFNNILAGTLTSIGTVELAKNVSQGGGSNRYLLLAKNGVASGGRLFGTIFGKRDGGANGRFSAFLNIYVADYSGTGVPAVSMQGAFNGVTPRIVTLTNDGQSWVALDAGGTGTASIFENAYFIGSEVTDGLVWRTSAQVTDIVEIKSTVTSTLGGHVEALSTGVLRPTTDNVQNLGSASNRWATVFAGTGSINTSDGREKQDIESLSETEKRVAIAIKGLIKKFKFKEAVRIKGDKARIHVGVIAQDVISAFEAEGLDPMQYGIVCYDQWFDEVDEEGNVISKGGNRYGVRYEELMSFLISAI